jgi:hypothetical protein
MALAMVEEEVDILIEGAQLLPEHAAHLAVTQGETVRSCFVGFADASLEEKLGEIREFGGGPDDWMRDYADDAVRSEISRFIEQSRQIRSECSSLGLSYIEIPPFALEPAIDSVVTCLTQTKEQE